MMKYCTSCLLPDTKPDLILDKHGVCGACVAYFSRDPIDWDSRRDESLKITSRYSKSGKWDCIVPVFGGKDSTWQVLKLLELGLRPLCVNATTCDETEIGRRNLRNIRNWESIASPTRQIH
jgi:hypothetical protein